jgi:hypothetical protein
VVDHLWVVIAPSLELHDHFICVNVSTKRERSDVTCELNRGEHPRLTSDASIIVYARAREFPHVLIKKYSEKQAIEPMPPNVLRRIQTAPLTETSRLTNKFKRAIQKYLSIVKD